MEDDFKLAKLSEKSVEQAEETGLHDPKEDFLITSITYDAEQNVVLETSWTCSTSNTEQPTSLIVRDFQDELADGNWCSSVDASSPEGAIAVFEYNDNGELVFHVVRDDEDQVQARVRK